MWEFDVESDIERLHHIHAPTEQRSWLLGILQNKENVIIAKRRLMPFMLREQTQTETETLLWIIKSISALCEKALFLDCCSTYMKPDRILHRTKFTGFKLGVFKLWILTSRERCEALMIYEVKTTKVIWYSTFTNTVQLISVCLRKSTAWMLN